MSSKSVLSSRNLKVPDPKETRLSVDLVATVRIYLIAIFESATLHLQMSCQ